MALALAAPVERSFGTFRRETQRSLSICSLPVHTEEHTARVARHSFVLSGVAGQAIPPYPWAFRAIGSQGSRADRAI